MNFEYSAACLSVIFELFPFVSLSFTSGPIGIRILWRLNINIQIKKDMVRTDYSDQFRNIIICYKLVGFNFNVMRQSACLAFKPITVNNYGILFNYTPVTRASDYCSLDLKLFVLACCCQSCFVFRLVHQVSTDDSLLL